MWLADIARPVARSKSEEICTTLKEQDWTKVCQRV